MRDYGKVHTSFWTSSNIRAMSEDGRALALYLLTCPHGTIAGVFRLPDGYACEDLQWDSERVKKGFMELLANGFANRCETTKWVWIAKHFEWNPPENPNQRKAAGKVAGQVPAECVWKSMFMRDCAEFIGLVMPSNPNPSETLPEPFLNQEQEQEQELNLCAPDGDAGDVKPIYPKAFEDFWSMYPRKKSKGDALKAFKKIKRAEYPIIKAGLLAAIDSPEWNKDCGQYIPYPASWLNDRGWEDEHGISSAGGNHFEGML